ncbi:clustered mitochondria-domain-containing protein, partial [Piptocephalis cylindrospora]
DSPSPSILARHRHDACRPAERWLLNGIDSGDAAASAYGGPGGMRDWNEELQGHRELPRATPAERLIRERLLHRLHVEFTAAATRGAIAVVEGEIPSLNPGTGEEDEGPGGGARMYLHEGIFYSCGYDDRGAIAALGGATGKDFAGVTLLNNVDPPGLSSIGTVVVDYKGERVVAQTIVPGIFQKQEQAVIYGAIEGEEGEKEIIVGDASMHDLLQPLAKSLHLREREVESSQGKEGEDVGKVKLWTSVDVKGLQGTDGRKYILDMYRSTPLDLPWLKQIKTEQEDASSSLPDYPHRLALLRPELVDLYWETQLRKWAGDKAEKIKEEVNEQFPLPAEEEEEEKKKDEEEDEKDKEEGKPKEKTEKELERERILGERRKTLEERLSKEIHLEEFDLTFDPDVTLESSSGKETDPEWKAGEFLRETLLPSFISDLVSYRLAPVDGESLVRAMHRNGLNVRYLGAITNTLEGREEEDRSRLAWILRILRREMILRSFKHLLRQAWKSIGIEEVRTVTASWLSQLLQGSPALGTQLVHWVQARFRYAMSSEDLSAWLEDELAGGRGGIPLLRETCRRMGIQLLARDYNLTSTSSPITNGNHKAYIFSSDVLNIAPIFKSSTPRAAMADEAFEHGRLSLSQESTNSSSEKEGQVGYELMMEAMALYEQTYGLLHPETAKCYASVATLLYHMGQQTAALEYQRKAVVGAERTCGIDHPDTINFYLNLGLFEQEVGDVPRSLRILRHAMDLWSYVHGPGHPDSITADSNVAVVLQGLQDHSKALAMLQRAKDTQVRCLGPRQLQTANGYHALARAHALKGDFKEAMSMEREAASIYGETVGPEDPRTRESEFWLQQLTTNAVLAARKAKEQAAKVEVPSPHGRLGMMKQGKGSSPGPKQPKARGELPIDELLQYIESPSRGKGKGKKASK